MSNFSHDADVAAADDDARSMTIPGRFLRKQQAEPKMLDSTKGQISVIFYKISLKVNEVSP